MAEPTAPAIATPGPEPIGPRRDLPAEPLRLADAPPGAPVRLGRLKCYRGKWRGRPLVALVVRCPRCGAEHRHPWRWDWGLDPTIASFQEARCRRGLRLPYWLALDPAHAAGNAAVHAEAHAAYLAWFEGLTAAREARRPAAVEAPDPAPPTKPKPVLTGFHLPPVGRRGG